MLTWGHALYVADWFQIAAQSVKRKGTGSVGLGSRRGTRIGVGALSTIMLILSAPTYGAYPHHTPVQTFCVWCGGDKCRTEEIEITRSIYTNVSNAFDCRSRSDREDSWFHSRRYYLCWVAGTRV